MPCLMGKNTAAMTTATNAIEGRPMPSGVEHIRTAVIGGVRVPFVRATPEQFPQLRETDGTLLDGFYDSVQQVVWIRAGQSPTQERDSLVHEGLHAFLYLTGLGHLIKSVCKRPAEYEDLEELIARTATPHLVAFILGEDSSWA